MATLGEGDPDALRAALVEVITVAHFAGEVLMRGFRQPRRPRVEFKGAIDLVTEFDRASEDLLRARLGSAFAECDLIAEESGGSVRGGRPVFYVDPLDGTTNFAHGHPFFCVSIGLFDENGRGLLGVVHAPALRWTHAAARGLGCTRDGEPVRVSDTSELDRALLATGFPYDRRTSAENNFRQFVSLKKRSQGIRRCGSAALDLCLVADGTYDGYWERKLNPWDLAAGAVLVEEAGGTVTSLAGGPFDPRGGNILATNGRVHGPVREALLEADGEPGL